MNSWNRTIVRPSWLDTDEKASRFWFRYRLFLGITAVIHLFSGIGAAIIVIKDDWPVRVCASYSVWAPTHAGFECFTTIYNVSGALASSGNGTAIFNTCNRISSWKHAGTIDPGAMVVAFFMLSFLFQIPCVFPDTAWTRRVNFEVYKGWLSVGVQPLRFLEYSISSTVMILVIALLCGQTDLWLLMAIAGCNWSCMIFGLLSEQIMRLRAEPLQLGTNFLGNVGAHLAGWVPFVIVWTIITSQFEWSLNAMEGVPGVVKAIPLVQLALFALFGINQMLGSLNLYRRPDPPPALQAPGAPDTNKPPKAPRWTYMHSEVAYTVLSLTAKSMLAWMLLGGTINQDPSKLVSHSLC